MRAWWLSLGMFVGALTIDTIRDEVPERPVERRAGYQVLQADFHVHTRFSDGVLFPFDVVREAERSGLDVVAVTEHNNVFPAKMAHWYAQTFGGPIVLVGEEVTTHLFHLIAVGLEREASWRLPLDELIDDIHAQGGIAIAAHPLEFYWENYGSVIDRLDGAEAVHPLAFRKEQNRALSYEEIVAFFDKYGVPNGPLAAIGSSDFHFFHAMGVCRTYVFVDSVTEAGVLDAVRAKRTVAFAPDGRAFGPPALVSALKKDPVSERFHYSYEARSWIDVLSRVLGVTGLFGLLLVASRLYEPSRVQRSSKA